MKKNRRISLILAAVLICLGACSPKTEGEEGTMSAAKKDIESEDRAGEKTSGQTGRKEGGKGEQESSDREAPYPLSLMTSSHYDHVWEEDRRLSYTDYRKIWLDDRKGGDPKAGVQSFPQLAQALKELNDQTEKSALDFLRELGDQAKEMAGEGFPQELSYQADMWAVRADSQVLSLLTWDYIYMGGAHGDYGYSGINFDSESGRKLELGDVVTDPEGFAELAAERLTEKYPDVDFFESPLDVIKKEVEDKSLVWTLGYEGITLYFSPYVLAPYAYGIQSVTILYEDAPDLFAKEICRVPDSWAVCLAPGMDFDLGHDGILDTVEAGGIYGEYGSESAYEHFRVSVNGQESIKELWFYRERSYLVHSDDLDTELLITETTSDNDFQITLVYELDPAREGFWTPWELPGHGFFSFYEEREGGDSRYGTELLTNPNHFQLQARFDLLSTYSGKRWYKISDQAKGEGYLMAETSWYDVDRGDQYLTLLVPLEMEAGDTGAARVFPDGTRLWIVRVEENAVTFRTEDWVKCRVRVEPTEWPGWVDGVEATEIFDGMMFAG